MSANFPQPLPIINRNASLVKRVGNYQHTIEATQAALDLLIGVTFETKRQFTRQEQVGFLASLGREVLSVCTGTAKRISQVGNVFVERSHNSIVLEHLDLSNA